MADNHDYRPSSRQTNKANPSRSTALSPTDASNDHDLFLSRSRSYDRAACGHEDCEHGTFSPRARSTSPTRGSGQELPTGQAGPYPVTNGDSPAESSRTVHAVVGDAIADGVFGNKAGMSTTKYLAKKHGVKHPRLM